MGSYGRIPAIMVELVISFAWKKPSNAPIMPRVDGGRCVPSFSGAQKVPALSNRATSAVADMALENRLQFIDDVMYWCTD